MKLSEQINDSRQKRGRKPTKMGPVLSSALPDIIQAVADAGFKFSKSYIYRVMLGAYGQYNADIMKIGVPILEKHAKKYEAEIKNEAQERALLEAERNKYLPV